MIYKARKPPETITHPQVRAISISKSVDTLLDLQGLGIPSFSLDIGPPGDTGTMKVTFQTPSGSVTVRKNNVLVQLTSGTYETYEDQAAFLAVYDIEP